MLSLQEVKLTIDNKTIDTFAADSSVSIVMQNMNNPYNLDTDEDCIIRTAVNFGHVVGGEKGYYGKARRVGVVAFSVFTLWGIDAKRNLEVCEKIEDTFRRLEIKHSSGEEIFFDDCYTEGGYLTETTKFCYIVYAPFWVWAGN